MSTVLITGANRGIGLEHVRRYADDGATVLAACRAPGAELLTLAQARPDRISTIAYDAADPQAGKALKAAVGHRPIDILFVNAGVYGGDGQRLGAIDPHAFMDTLRINTLAPLLVVDALVDNVAASQRRLVALQSSLMGSIADNGSGGYHAYRASKAALNMLAKGLSVDLAGKGVTVVTLHPGWVRTRMGGPNAPVRVEDCVAGQQKLLNGLTTSQSGGFFDYTGKPLPW
jgi:NAD(P)-dependent dehydrogenase (short-subunit alcohol dehydrogenase family)